MLANLLLLGMTPCANSALFEKSLGYENSKGKHELDFVVSEPLRPRTALLQSLLLESLQQAETRLGLPLLEDASYVFDADPLEHNGLTTVVPTNRIFVHTEAPLLGSSIGTSGDYLRETIVHETGHLLALQRHGGVFSVLDVLFGNVSRPNGAWPRWMHEGIAVWTEDVIGGRPSSGSVDYDLRRYAEAFRSGGKQHPLGSSDLDGSGRLERFSEGQVPYTFGYLLIEAASKKMKLADFTENSSRSLGISFRPSFRAQGIQLDELLRTEQATWASTPLGSDLEGRIEIARSPQLYGPYRGQAERIAWIERDPWRGKTQIAWSNFSDPSPKIERLEWKQSLQTPLGIHPLSDELWIVFLRTHPDWSETAFFDRWRPYERQTVLFDPKTQQILCRFELPTRVREISLAGQEMAWIDGGQDGIMRAWRARWSDKDCALSEQQELARSAVPFERLSSIELSAQGWSLSRAPGRNGFRERIESAEGLWSLEHPLGWARPIGSDGKHWIAQEFSRLHWGPALVTRTGKDLEVRRLPVVTGSQGVSALSNGVLVNEGYWRDDRLAQLPLAKMLSVPVAYRGRIIAATEGAAPSPSETLESKNSSESLKTYRPWSSIWPHFWLPNLSATDRGVSVQGTTFYQDLSGLWRGSSWVGYDSLTKRPSFSTSMAYRSHELSAAYLPVPLAIFGLDETRAQGRWRASYLRDFPYALSGRLKGNLQPSLDFESAAQTPSLDGYQRWIPGLLGEVASQHGRDPSSTVAPLSQTETGFLLQHRLRYIRGLEASASLHTQTRLGPSGLLLSLEGAGTAKSNFPVSYFLWGGLPTLGTGSSTYLSRGFVPRAAAAQALIRASLEWAWPVWTDNIAFSWNRLGLSDAELKVVAETVSWDSFFDRSAYRIGKQAFSTLGTELDVFGSALHYVQYRMSLGLFQGLGEFGETRFALVLRSGFDL